MITADNMSLSSVLGEIPEYLLSCFTIPVQSLFISQRCFFSPTANGLKINFITNAKDTIELLPSC